MPTPEEIVDSIDKSQISITPASDGGVFVDKQEDHCFWSCFSPNYIKWANGEAERRGVTLEDLLKQIHLDVLLW